ncbi:MAG: N-acetylmuramoyl-L-alanine amidase [Clostridiales bacterium]|nr:N-acetylmuramoyl-L-alanine amidase [Clostridiales bacterium]
MADYRMNDRRRTSSNRRPPQGNRPAYGRPAERRPASGRPGMRPAPSGTGAPRRPQGKARYRIEKPGRLITAGLILVLLIFLLSKLGGGHKTAEPQTAESSQDTADRDETYRKSQEESAAAEEEKELGTGQRGLYSGYKTTVSELDDQVMGFMSGMILAHIDNHAKDPDQQLSVQKVRYNYHVVIDPAHGGEDVGFMAGDVSENRLNLIFAQKIQGKVRELDPAIDVVLTRDNDVFVELADRVSLANNRDADLFVNIQCASNEEDPEANGLGVLYWDSEEGTPRGKESLHIGMKISEVAAEALGLKDRGVRSDMMEVLYETTMPALSIKLGYLTNEQDLAALTDEVLQDRMAEAVAKVIVEAVNQHEPHVDVNIPEVTTAKDDDSASSSDAQTDSSETSSEDSYEEESYTEDSYEEDSYAEDSYEEESYEEDGYEGDGYEGDGYEDGDGDGDGQEDVGEVDGYDEDEDE